MQIRNIPITEIVTSELNPRKTINQDELQELAQSIKENGLIQPITVRKSGKKFEIVCGERRFRACQLIGEETIQCVVKNLDDKQAFACMIIENLQRKDVDPIEESAALNTLYKTHSVSVKDMAKMLGKSTSYVFGRIQLNNTIPQFIQLMRDGSIVLTHLLEICKLTKEQQEILYEQCFTEDSRQRWPEKYKYKYPNIPQLNELIDEHVMNYLEMANFSMDDETFEDAPACESCPMNTKNNPDRFNDVARPRCMKRECFMRKYRETVFRNGKLSGLPMIYSGSYEDNEEIVKYAEENGIEILGLGLRNYVVKPEEPDKSVFQDEETYAKRMETYEKAKSVFDENLKEGNISEIFEVCYGGKLTGEVRYVYSIPEKAEDNSDVAGKENDRERIYHLKTQLAECDEKKKIAIVEAQRDSMEKSEYSALNTELSNLERAIFIALILKKLPTSFKESIGMTLKQMENFKAGRAIAKDNVPCIVREFIRICLSEKSVNYSKDLSAMLSEIMNSMFVGQAEEIENQANERYGAMKSNIQAKIEEIKASRKKEEEQTPEAPNGESEE